MNTRFLAMAAAAFALVAGEAQAIIISSQLDSTAAGSQPYLGQGVTTSAGGPWNNIGFSFDSTIGAGTTNFALGDLFILSSSYAGTPAALSSATAGFVAQSTGISSSRWVFDSSVVLNASTTYYFLMGDRANDSTLTLAGRFDGSAPGLYFAACSTCNYDTNTNDFDYILSGDVVAVPEPATLLLLSIGLLLVRRRRRV